MEDFIAHYGTPRHSGRYPWGSGENPYQHEDWFLHQYNSYKRDGKTDNEIAKLMNMSTTEFRQKRSLSQNAQRAAQTSDVVRLHDEQGLGWTEISRRMGIPESTVRNLYNPILKERNEMTSNTAEKLKESIAEKKYIDVGPGVENYMGVSATKLKTAVAKLKEEGYTVHYIQVEQLGTGKKTTVQVIAGPDVKTKDIYDHMDEIKLPIAYSENGGRSFLGLEPINNIDSSRIQIRYAEDGGKNKDGVIELRKGVEDLSLGDARYAQVRIGVDGTHYLKGMAMYGTDMPPGVDIVFNTNKTKDVPFEKVLKEMKDDPDNPFGATVKQRHYTGSDGEDHLSAINVVASGDKVNEEGRWNEWSRTLSSQFLSKQAPALAQRQLNLTYTRLKSEFDNLEELNNPVVKQQLLLKFAEECDSSAVHLQAASLPRQATHVILPITDMPENQIYAPKYRDGEKVVLIRYPHGGVFEIPELIVNNKQATANKVIPNAIDAVGINPKVAEQLSGADFDGDTVVVIPTNGVKIKTSAPLQGLKDFDPKLEYKLPDDAPRMKSKTKQQEMGKVSNLITDMTIKGATEDEICRAVRHSMVVIDAEKHHLDYKKSEVDNGIAQLKEKYQGGANRGASTLISKASSEIRVKERKELTPNRAIDPETGEKRYEETGRTYKTTTVNKKGEKVVKEHDAMEKTTRMAEAKDAYELSSGTKIESVYAEHANKLKAMANEARKEAMAIKFPKQVPSARQAYAEEVSSLNAKLNEARKNKPLERQAQIRANDIVNSKKVQNPELKNDNDALKKVKSQALDEARYEVGAKRKSIEITDKEWEAIQAGAISSSKLQTILGEADEQRVRELATPRSAKTITPAKEARIRSMYAQNYSLADIADALGLSASTVSKYVN